MVGRSPAAQQRRKISSPGPERPAGMIRKLDRQASRSSGQVPSLGQEAQEEEDVFKRLSCQSLDGGVGGAPDGVAVGRRSCSRKAAATATLPPHLDPKDYFAALRSAA